MNKSEKKLYVPQNYLGFAHVNDINVITSPFFDQTPINFFDYARIYYDGSWTYFTSKNELSTYLFDSGFVFLPKINIAKKFNYYLLSTFPEFAQLLAELKNNFNVSNILASVVKHQNYIDIYWFGANEDGHNATNFYLNNLDLIRSNMLSFDEKAADLIKLAEKDRIVIPSLLKDDYNDAFRQIKLQGNFYSLYLEGISIQFSKRQYECLTLIAQGCTAKMIANKLSLSVRTVECYLNIIKSKLSCHSRPELIKLLMQSCSNQLY